MIALTGMSCRGGSRSTGVDGEKGRTGIVAIEGGDNGSSSSLIFIRLPGKLAAVCSVSVEEREVDSRLLTGLRRSIVDGIGESGSPLSLPPFLALRLTAMDPDCLLVFGLTSSCACCRFLAITALLTAGETLTAGR